MKTPNCFAVFVALFGTLFTISTSASGQAVQWTQAEGGNGNWYELVIVGSFIEWDAASDAAEAVGGHLATIGSAEENQFVYANCGSDLAGWVVGPLTAYGPWLGGTTDGSSWYWVDGTDWTYSNWNTGEPNGDINGRVHFHNKWSESTDDQWNDISHTVIAYIVEYSADCNGDGMVDYGQILSGELADADGNGVPDCCDDTSCLAPVQWKIEDGGNGNWYGVVQMSENICWEDARSYAIAQGGDLATPTTLDEDLLLKSVIQFIEPGSGTYIGGFQNLESPQYSEPLGGWEWVTGESWSYSNWHPSEPENAYGGEHYLAADFNGPVYGWFDLGGPNHPDGPCHKSALAIEWSADCNGDGMVDYGQILSGELADADGNGVPDICELITVDDDGLDDPDADFDNIQDAVNAASDGDEILVMPGTYTSTSSAVVKTDGKLIWLRSAAGPDVTVIDGEDSRRGIHCPGGETSETTIDGFTIINGHATGGGIAGYGGGILCGNASANSSPTIVNCNIIGNTSQYGGGGIYSEDSSPIVANCTISGNSAGTNGGGLCGFNSTITLSDTSFSDNTADSNSGGGLCLTNSSIITADDCTFTGNTAAFDGGGIYVDDSTATLTGCDFNSNTSSDYGGAIALPNGTANLSDCNFTGNQASYGGAVGQNSHDGGCNSTFTDCQFINNTTIGNDPDGGAVLAAYSVSTTFDNCVFSGNSSQWRGGGVSVHVGADASMLNCEVSNNSADSSPGDYTGGGGIIVAYGGTLNLSDTIVCGNTPDQVGGQDGYNDNGGNFVEDICECAGDIIDDGVVDLIDFTAFLVNFGATGENIADLNGDLVVDLNDFSIFLVNYGNVCETRSAVAETGLGKVAPTHHIGGVPRRSMN